MFDWVRHGCELREELLKKAPRLVKLGRMTPAEHQVLEIEIEHRRRVMMKLRGYTVQLSPVDAVWHDYMVAHAGLQVDRRSGLIDECEFYTRCYALIDLRDELLKGLDDVYSRAK